MERHEDGLTSFDFRPQGLTFLAGGNNSGKSTLLQALAIWEFCRSLIEIERGTPAFLATFRGHPVGLTAEEFTPVALPDMKHLWHNLNTQRTTADGGYSLKIVCEWPDDDVTKPMHRVGFTLSLAHDRLYVKPCDSNLAVSQNVPHMAYLPPFAGIQPKEERMSPARQKRLIGQGLAGGVLRNILYELWDQNRQEITRLKGDTGRISGTEKARFRKSDPWERLSEVLEQVFKVGLTVNQFNDLYHTTIKVVLFDGQLINAAFKPKPNVSTRDIMVEGSGFLQYLTFANKKLFDRGLGSRMWKRRNIENYLIVPQAIARAANRPVDEVITFLREKHAIHVTADYLQHNCPDALASPDGKKIVSTGNDSIATQFGITYSQIAQAMEPDEIAEDIKTLLQQITDLCS